MKLLSLSNSYKKIMVDDLVYCGMFETEYAAAIAYDLAVKSWHGEFASCNILSNGEV